MHTKPLPQICFVYLLLLKTGAPLLGAPDTIKATLSGSTFGLPISEVTF